MQSSLSAEQQRAVCRRPTSRLSVVGNFRPTLPVPSPFPSRPSAELLRSDLDFASALDPDASTPIQFSTPHLDAIAGSQLLHTNSLEAPASSIRCFPSAIVGPMSVHCNEPSSPVLARAVSTLHFTSLSTSTGSQHG